VTPEPLFVLPDVMLDIADDVLEREVAVPKVSVMPPDVEVTPAQTEAFSYPPQLTDLTRVLAQLEDDSALPDVVVGGGFAQASYRYSLLTFLGEKHEDADLNALAEQPFRLTHALDAPLQAVHRNEVAAMTAGQLIKHTPAKEG
jgi:hypothetical protein